MGRIKQKFIKKTALELYDEMPEKFSTHFDKTKLAVNELKLSESKKIRNKIAGYIVRTARLNKAA